MLAPKQRNQNAFHLAGVIPVAGQPLDFNFDWSDCLMPLAPNYTAVERSVIECAYAGCETIWIVCNDDVSPLIRHRIGELVYDPIWYGRVFDPRPSESRKTIPIYYVPIHPKDREKRDCLGWSVLHGAVTAFKIGAKISKWLTPNKYYVSFPYGVYEPELLRDYRKDISSTKPFYLSYKDKTIADGEYLGFTFDGKDFVRYRRVIRKEGTGMWDGSELVDNKFATKKLPVKKRYSARFFSLDKIFRSAILEDAVVSELPWYHNIDSWENYCNFIGSKNRDRIFRPTEFLLKYREFNPIGEDNETN